MVSIKELHTFQMPVAANAVTFLKSDSDIELFLKRNQNQQYYLIGGGSNVVFTEDFKGEIGVIQTKGKTILAETEDQITIEFQAGENWHEVVQWSVQQNYGGIENLALIPGCIGAAPIQNIGAYGVEIKDVLQHVTVYSIPDDKLITLSNQDCLFDYRNSIFKQTLKGKVVVLSVALQLSKRNHQLKLGYGDIQTVYERNAIKGIEGVMKAVIEIRESKLPDPKKIGNSGSFFKNPIVSKELAESLLNEHPIMPTYTVENGVKIPAGWLIDQLGWKGKEKHGIQIHPKQALVLTNKGVVEPKKINNLIAEIQQSVWEKYTILLEPEVNVL